MRATTYGHWYARFRGSIMGFSWSPMGDPAYVGAIDLEFVQADGKGGYLYHVEKDLPFTKEAGRKLYEAAPKEPDRDYKERPILRGRIVQGVAYLEPDEHGRERYIINTIHLIDEEEENDG